MSGWTVVIPVKAVEQAKSRLGERVAPSARAALARAFALDTITAAAACPVVDRVLVVGDESELTALVASLDPDAVARVDVVDEGRRSGLAAAIRLGVERARAGAGVRAGADTDSQADADAAAGAPVAVLLGDLPSLTPAELAAGLEAAARHPLAFVPDADGTGTTIATAGDGVAFAPSFGEGSAARHTAAGFTDLALAAPDTIGPGLRRDVDTVEALELVLEVGVGRHTAEAVAALADAALPHDQTHLPWTSRNSGNRTSTNGKGTP